MKYFLDTEFLEGPQKKRIFGIPYGNTSPTIDLISIGIVAEDGREYYAISKDFNLKEAWNRYDLKEICCPIEGTPSGKFEKVYWIRENVLRPIHKELCKKTGMYAKTHHHELFADFTYKSLKNLIRWYGESREQIAQDVEYFTLKMPTIEDASCELYAYYGAYDHVAFMWLWGKMLNKPKHLPMFSVDLKQVIDEKVFSINSLAKSEKLHSEKITVDGFQYPFLLPDTTDNLLKAIKSHPDYPRQDNAHNALDDAQWNKKLYEFIQSL